MNVGRIWGDSFNLLFPQYLNIIFIPSRYIRLSSVSQTVKTEDSHIVAEKPWSRIIKTQSPIRPWDLRTFERFVANAPGFGGGGCICVWRPYLPFPVASITKYCFKMLHRVSYLVQFLPLQTWSPSGFNGKSQSRVTPVRSHDPSVFFGYAINVQVVVVRNPHITVDPHRAPDDRWVARISKRCLLSTIDRNYSWNSHLA